MRYTPPRSVGFILNSECGSLRSLRRHAARLQQIQVAVDDALPAAVGHVRVAGCDDGRLLLIADSGTWATRLRYQRRDILQSLARHLRLGVDELDIRVRPLSAPGAKPLRPRTLSPAARKSIGECGRLVQDNPQLAAALARLARAGRGRED